MTPDDAKIMVGAVNAQLRSRLRARDELDVQIAARRRELADLIHRANLLQAKLTHYGRN